MAADSRVPPAVDHEQQRSEVESVLGAEMFKRAPSLSQILAYVCEQHFAGAAEKIKEYNIAVEALGRGAEFDPSADTIVRVEASRLRKRLAEYYAAEGANHKLEIRLAKSGYVPQFVPRRAPEDTPVEAGAEPPAAMTSGGLSSPVGGSASDTQPAGPKLSRRVLLTTFAVVVILILVAAALYLLPAFRASKPEASAGKSSAVGAAIPPRPPAASPVPQPSGGIRLLAGFMRPEFLDSLGRVWSGDEYFTGGRAAEAAGGEIMGVLDPTIYRTSRTGDFRYDIPLRPGTYELHLLFAETRYGKGNRVYDGEGSRIFHVSINGERRLTLFDILTEAGGPDIPADRVFKDISPDKTGFLRIEFVSVTGRALLNGIEILPGTPGKMLPVRIVCGGRSYYDREGRLWGADRYFVGGRPMTKPTVVLNTPDPELYGNERWGSFKYVIPVAAGRYRLTLKFAEVYYGRSNQGGGVSSRVFDVYCNGAPLLRNFDIYKEAGRENTALDKVFHGLQPNAQGNLTLSFAPVTNYPTVKAIEVVDESP
jgi:hypothetical protein